MQRRQCGNDGRLCAQDQGAERSFLITTALSRLEFLIGPATLRTDRQDCLCVSMAFQNFP